MSNHYMIVHATNPLLTSPIRMLTVRQYEAWFAPGKLFAAADVDVIEKSVKDITLDLALAGEVAYGVVQAANVIASRICATVLPFDVIDALADHAKHPLTLEGLHQLALNVGGRILTLFPNGILKLNDEPAGYRFEMTDISGNVKKAFTLWRMFEILLAIPMDDCGKAMIEKIHALKPVPLNQTKVESFVKKDINLNEFRKDLPPVIVAVGGIVKNILGENAADEVVKVIAKTSISTGIEAELLTKSLVGVLRGNRDYEDSLLNLCYWLDNRGIKISSVGEFKLNGQFEVFKSLEELLVWICRNLPHRSSMFSQSVIASTVKSIEKNYGSRIPDAWDEKLLESIAIMVLGFAGDMSVFMDALFRIYAEYGDGTLAIRNIAINYRPRSIFPVVGCLTGTVKYSCYGEVHSELHTLLIAEFLKPTVE